MKSLLAEAHKVIITLWPPELLLHAKSKTFTCSAFSPERGGNSCECELFLDRRLISTNKRRGRRGFFFTFRLMSYSIWFWAHFCRKNQSNVWCSIPIRQPSWALNSRPPGQGTTVRWQVAIPLADMPSCPRNVDMPTRGAHSMMLGCLVPMHKLEFR